MFVNISRVDTKGSTYHNPEPSPPPNHLPPPLLFLGIYTASAKPKGLYQDLVSTPAPCLGALPALTAPASGRGASGGSGWEGGGGCGPVGGAPA